MLADRITNGTLLINEQIRAGKKVMFEGAQGAMLDIDHGTYPYVTSSSTVVGGVCTGLGVAPKHIHRVIGVAKAYTTRVGGGAFPTELNDAHGEHLRARGNEFGTVTGRPRRTGWLDLPVLRTSAMLNGLDAIALTKLDVLDEFDEIPVCIGYNVRGAVLENVPGLRRRASRLQAGVPHVQRLEPARRSASRRTTICRRQRRITSASSRTRSSARPRSSRRDRGAKRRSCGECVRPPRESLLRRSHELLEQTLQRGFQVVVHARMHGRRSG